MRRTLLASALARVLVDCSSYEPKPVPYLDASCAAADSAPISVRFYTNETFWRHSPNPLARKALALQAAQCGWDLREIGTAAFTPTDLAGVDVVAFVLSSGDSLSGEQRAAFEQFLQRGVVSLAYTQPHLPNLDGPSLNAFLARDFVCIRQFNREQFACKVQAIT